MNRLPVSRASGEEPGTLEMGASDWRRCQTMVRAGQVTGPHLGRSYPNISARLGNHAKVTQLTPPSGGGPVPELT